MKKPKIAVCPRCKMCLVGECVEHAYGVFNPRQNARREMDSVDWMRMRPGYRFNSAASLRGETDERGNL